MIKWLLDEFLLILLLNIPYDCVKFISYASYRNNHRNEVKFWPKIKILVALDIKNWGFQLKRVGRGSRDKKMQENLEKLTVDHDRWPLTRRSTGWGTGRSVRRGWEFKKPPARFISPIFASRACHPFTSLLPEDSLVRFRTDCRLKTWFWDGFGLGFWFETQVFTSWEHFFPAPCVSGLFSSISRCGPAFFTCVPTQSARLAFYLWKINFWKKVGVVTYFIFILKGK